MGKIFREPSAAATATYDLIIIGGGIYGVMLSLEASKKGLSSLLLERDDFGGGTTFNSLRIIHGGLRYLQSLDLRRFRESVGERSWFLRNFPDLVKPLPCIMPLYGNGLRRPAIFRFAFWADDLLSRVMNRGIGQERHLPRGQIVEAEKTREIFPAVEPRGLQGAAIWYDAFMPDSQRLVIEIQRLACKMGAMALNYMEAKELLRTRRGVAGVMAIDCESGKSYEYKASVVINAAGPWCQELASRFDRDEPNLFRSSLAWNVLLDRKPLSDHAVAVAPKKSGARTCFLLPWKDKLLAGTGHAPLQESPERALPSDQQLQEFLGELNLAVPGLEVDQGAILHVFAGLLPVKRAGTVDLTVREVILDHTEHGGPQGFYSISGVKFTTARLVAERALNMIFPLRKSNSNKGKKTCEAREASIKKRGIFNYDLHLPDADSKSKNTLYSIIDEESVHHLDDLVFRRTNLWENPVRAIEIAPLLCEFFGWSLSRRRQELDRLHQSLGNSRFQS